MNEIFGNLLLRPPVAGWRLSSICLHQIAGAQFWLDPNQSAFNIGAMIRWPHFNDIYRHAPISRKRWAAVDATIRAARPQVFESI